nr:hypothetical protein [Micromonospora sp. DSM 115978]
MRRAIETLFTRLLRSRLGIALVLAVVILGIVGATRLVAGPLGSDTGVTGAPVEPIETVHPTTGDDGVLGTGPPPAPSTSPGAAPPETVARQFATAWLDHREVTAEQWYATLLPLATAELAERLAGVDPVGVPADRLTGEPVVIPQTARLVEVTLPVDSGRLRLELVAPDGRWLVDTVDWERA